MNFIVLDIETLGTKPKSVVYEISAININVNEKEPNTSFQFMHKYLQNTFSEQLDITEQILKHKRTIEQHSIDFLHEQNLKPRNNVKDIKTVLKDLNQWLKSTESNTIFVRGVDFDKNILESLYDDYNLNLDVPRNNFIEIKSWLNAYNTFIEKVDFEEQRKEIYKSLLLHPHNSFDDCLADAGLICGIMNKAH